jgi:glycine cleavage system H protein
MKTPNDRLYSREHEWALKKEGRVVVGITDHAQDQLGDVIFVDLPEVGAEVTAGEAIGEAESTKTVSEVYSPVTGKVVERNEELQHNPELLNEDPYGRGWLVVVEVSEEQESLMTAEEYLSLIEGSQD